MNLVFSSPTFKLFFPFFRIHSLIFFILWLLLFHVLLLIRVPFHLWSFSKSFIILSQSKLINILNSYFLKIIKFRCSSRVLESRYIKLIVHKLSLINSQLRFLIFFQLLLLLQLLILITMLFLMIFLFFF